MLLLLDHFEEEILATIAFLPECAQGGKASSFIHSDGSLVKCCHTKRERTCPGLRPGKLETRLHKGQAKTPPGQIRSEAEANFNAAVHRHKTERANQPAYFVQPGRIL